MFSLSELKDELNSRVVEVTFKKVNGDLREMTCTTCPDLISAAPVKDRPSPDELKDYGSQIRVFDVKAQGWRSFRFENVIEVK